MYKSAYMVQIMISKGSIKEGGGKEKLKTKACTVYPISKKKKKKNAAEQEMQLYYRAVKITESCLGS